MTLLPATEVLRVLQGVAGLAIMRAFGLVSLFPWGGPRVFTWWLMRRVRRGR